MAPAEVKALESAKPFILGEWLAPIPPSVVKKIQNFEFVNFAELMPDNRELLHRIDLTDNKASTKAPLRRVTTITSWAQFFMAYSAILLSQVPRQTSGSHGIWKNDYQRGGSTQWRGLESS